MFKIIENFKLCDKILWILVLIISSYSLILIKSLSREGQDFFNTQLFAVVLGLLGALFFQNISYKKIVNAWFWIAPFCFVLLVYTFFFGIAIEGKSGVNAKAWIKIFGNITFQPSELVKISFIITFSKHLEYLKLNNKLNEIKKLILVAVHAVLPMLLMHFQGDDGAAIIFFFIALSMAFVAEVKLRYFAVIFFLGIVAFPILWKFVLAPYQKQRFLNQLNPESDPFNFGYQQIQGKLSIGSGGLFGLGLYKGIRVENKFVPIQESDFIFSVAGEELGFIGCIAIIILIFFLILKIMFIAKKADSISGNLICFGLIGLIVAQSIFNLGMCLSLLPVMGVTLPFFSTGGSSVICLFFAIGIIQNISINQNEKKLFGRTIFSK